MSINKKTLEELEQRLNETKQALLIVSSSLASQKKIYQKISREFSDLCEEKERLEKSIWELSDKIKIVPSGGNTSSSFNRGKAFKEKSQKDPFLERKLSAKKEYEEVQNLLKSLGLSRKEED